MLASEVLKDRPRIRDFCRGDTLIYRLNVTDNQGQPVDLQGQVAWLTMKKVRATENALQIRYEFPATSSVYAGGAAYLYVPFTETNDLEKGLYDYDVQLVLQLDGPSGDTIISTVVKDTVYVNEDITRKVS